MTILYYAHVLLYEALKTYVCAWGVLHILAEVW